MASTSDPATAPLPPLPSSSFTGRPAAENADGDISPTSYQLLLKQVESLKKENSTLKAELKSNTTHINKLENEASRMKGMVLMLGSPALPVGGVEPNYTIGGNYSRQSGLLDENVPPFVSDDISVAGQHNCEIQPLQTPLKLQNGIDQGETRKHRPEFLLGLAQPSQGQQYRHPKDHMSSPRLQHAPSMRGAISPSPTRAVADGITKILMTLKTEKASTLRNLNLEEQKKVYYLEQLKELTNRLDSFSESDMFTKPNDKTRQQIEIEIETANLQRTVEQSLGTGKAMQDRLEARLKHIHFIESEIASLEQHLRKLEMTPTSPGSSPAFQQNSRVDAGPDADAGVCSKHGYHLSNGVSLRESSTQTPKLLEEKRYEEEFVSCHNNGSDQPTDSGSGRLSRTAQTVVSCFTSPHAASAWGPQTTNDLCESEPKPPGSIDSLPAQSDIDETASMHSFTTSFPPHFQPSLGRKDGLLSPSLLQADKDELCRRFQKMSESVEGCRSMKQKGYLPLILQIIHNGALLSSPPGWTNPLSPDHLSSTISDSPRQLKESRITMGQVLWNIVSVTADAKGGHEMQIFKTTEILRRYSEQLYEFWIYCQTIKENEINRERNKNQPVSVNGYSDATSEAAPTSVKNDKPYDLRSGIVTVYEPPINEINAIRNLSFYESMKKFINEFGGIYAVAELFVLHCRCISCDEIGKMVPRKDMPSLDERNLLLLRQFIGFSLINLTYEDMQNKSILVQMPGFIDTLVARMPVDSEEIQQVLALFVRNLSWQSDEKCRDILRQKNVAAVFMKCALKSSKESTLKSLLSALWNLSGQCPENGSSICAVKGALAFLASTLTYRVHEVVESGGGILKNISSIVATDEEYRKVLREKNCLQNLLKQLKATSLTVVSNACGTLWNLSARNAQDQKLLWDFGAVPMLKNLVNSKHSVISQGSAGALRNLLSYRPGTASGAELENNEGTKLKARKQKGSDMLESGKTLPDAEKASWHHAQSSASEKMASRSAMSPQRHSLQEKSSSSPLPDWGKARRLQKSGLHYSGSLGSLPSTELSENLTRPGMKYVPTARNSASYPDHYSSKARNTSPPNNLKTFKSGFAPVGGGMLKDVMMFSDMPKAVPQATPPTKKPETIAPPGMSLRQYFKMLGERKIPRPTGASATTPQSGSAVPEHEGIPTTRSPYYPTGLPQMAWSSSEQPMIVPPSGTSQGSRMRSILQPQPRSVQKLLDSSSGLVKVNNPLMHKCPEDLRKILHNVEDDYENDDDPVNYSLQYRDEHMTPGIQSPRTEEIYELAAEQSASAPSTDPQVADLRLSYIHSQMTNMPPGTQNGPATKSDGGLSGLSSCIESTGSSAPPKRDPVNSGQGLTSTDGNTLSLQTTMHLTNVKSTNERSIVDPSEYDFIGYEDEKPTNFGAIYSEEQLYEPISHESMGLQPFTPKNLSAEANQQPNAINSSQSTSAIEDPANDASGEGEERDKFDTGTVTPGHAYYSHRSGRNSGIMTPWTPLEDNTPMMFSRSSSLGSVSDGESIHSSISSGTASRMMSGFVSPSHLPDSPSQSMPETPRRSPPPRVVDTHPADAAFLERSRSSQSDAKHPPIQTLTPVEESDKSVKYSVQERIEDQMRKLEQPGYVTSMPPRDEVNVFHSEGAMSVMTKFSALTIDSNDKVQPIANRPEILHDLQPSSESKTPSSTNKGEDGEKKHNAMPDSSEDSKSEKDGKTTKGLAQEQALMLHAGYTPSVPTTDEIKNFMHEGSLSPMTSFSEISCLKADNEGFQKSTGSVFSASNSTGSRRAGGGPMSFASRSSATGASVPPPAPEKIKESSDPGHSTVAEGQKAAHGLISPTSLSNDGENKEDEDSDSLPSSSSEDDELLQRCIQQAIPKKVSKSSSRGASSSRALSKSGRTSRSKEKSSNSVRNPSGDQPVKKDEDRSKTNPSPEVVSEKEKRRINIKQKLESANMKLKGVHIVEYIDNMINKSEGNDETDEASKNASAKSKEVINTAEKLQQSYSVRKKLKETGKQGGKTSNSDAHRSSTQAADVKKTINLLPSDPTPSMQSKLRIQSYFREGLTSYATEGTPIEMSRSTSLSNITIDSVGPEHQESNFSQSQLKTSRSEPDFQSVGVDILGEMSGERDSREILEALGKQIESLSITTVENVITSSKDPGYTRSMPHTDEIRKYAAEGSQFGGTEFSALTIDSETKIAPTVPKEIVLAGSSHIGETRTSHANGCPEEHRRKNDQTLQSQHSAVTHRLNSSEQTTHIMKNDEPSSWPTVVALQPSSHYNDDNDNLAMREEKRNYMIEDTPLNLSGQSSLSSLDFGSDDGNELLNACISSALPPERKTSNPLYPAQLVAAPQAHYVPDSLGRYNHGIPDGKVDSPVERQMHPSLQLLDPPNIRNHVTASHGFSTDFQSPTEEQFALFQQEAESISAELIQRSQYKENRAMPASCSPDVPPSSSFSLTHPTDGFYRLSQQDSIQDSDLSVSSSVLGDHQVHEMQTRSVRSPSSSNQQIRNPVLRQHPGKSPSQTKHQNQKVVKSGKKFSPSQAKDANAARRGRSNQNRVRESSSGSSSSYQKQQKHRHMSGTNRSAEICNCQVAPSRQQYCCGNGPVSASASHIADGMKSPGRPRRKSTNSASKNSAGGCEHNSYHHHHPKPSRQRNSAKNLYRPCVVQIYPALKDMAGVLEGVASVAARGDKVVADRPAQHLGNMSKKSSSSSLVRSATFINESPSQILLENITQEEKERLTTKSSGSVSSLSPSQSQNSSRGVVRTHSSPQASSNSLRQKSKIPSRRGSSPSPKPQTTTSTKKGDNLKSKANKKVENPVPTKPKHKKVWSGIKKLLSPSDDPSSSSKDKDKNKGTNKKGAPKKSVGSPNTAKKAHKATEDSVVPAKKIDQTVPQRPIKQTNSSSSSLSLSSSGSNNSSDYEPEHLPLRNAITPYGLLPKSPSVNAVSRRAVSTVPQSHSMGVLNGSGSQKQVPTVWRKTPPKLENALKSTSDTCSSTAPSSQALSSVTKSAVISGSEDVWISKKAAACQKNPQRTDASASSFKISNSQAQDLQPASENARHQVLSPTVPGFQSPPRTQSPRVVQQVAPFNYKPSPRKATENLPARNDKNVYQSRKVGPDCKQTPV